MQIYNKCDPDNVQGTELRLFTLHINVLNLHKMTFLLRVHNDLQYLARQVIGEKKFCIRLLIKAKYDQTDLSEAF